jgi:NADPH:quinone reductase-like Zn-dependent oxidoreductase
MRAWQLTDDPGAAPLRLATLPDPEPGANEVVVRPHAVALNYRDLVVARGGYQRRVPVGAIPCSDGAGEVVATGTAVRGVHVGDRVTSVFAPDWVTGAPTRAALRSALGTGQAPGMLAELVVLPASAVLPMSPAFTFEEAATLPCAALTAWHALFEVGACGPGTTVLTLGTGGVSTFAVQFARAAGATVIATSSSPAKLARLREMGVAHAINYRDQADWGEHVRSLTPGEEGADLVVEVGGQGTLEQSMRAVRPGGTIALIGTLAGPSPVALSPLFLRNIRLQGILVGSRDMFVRMHSDLARWQIRPVIDRIFGFEDAAAAYAHLAGGAHLGKVVVRVGRG